MQKGDRVASAGPDTLSHRAHPGASRALVVELVIVTTVLQIVLGDGLVVTGHAVHGENREDPGQHDDAEVVVQAGDGVLGGVDDDVVLVANHIREQEGLDAVVQRAALVLALEQERGDAGLEKLERAVEEASYRLTLWLSWPQAQQFKNLNTSERLQISHF